jgi:hypothetical protein
MGHSEQLAKDESQRHADDQHSYKASRSSRRQIAKSPRAGPSSGRAQLAEK